MTGRVAPGTCPEALTDPDVNLSIPPARATAGRLPPSAQTCRFLPLPVDLAILDAGDLPPSLHEHYLASPLLRSSPPLASASVRSASRFLRLHLFPYHR